MKDNELDRLFNEWDEVYKKGKLTFWILLAIYDGKKYSAEINRYIMNVTQGAFSVKEQSLYRALRRFSNMELVVITKEDSPNGGPQRKFFQLTISGEKLLERFVATHMSPLWSPHVGALLKELTNKKGIKHE